MPFDVAVIGGGPAGYTAAELAARAGLNTILFEKNAIGGVCLNVGCIPTKTLLYSAKLYDALRSSSKYGVSASTPSFDLPKIIQRKNKVVKKLTAGIRALLHEQGVTVVAGEASVLESGDNLLISCGGEQYEAKKLIFCTGSETIIPPVPGLADSSYWTSSEALDAKVLPASLLIIGGGVIGVEFAAYFSALGVPVTVVEMMDEILPGMDREMASLLRTEYSKRGVTFLLNAKAERVSDGAVDVWVNGEEQRVEAAQLLVSVGRRPVLKGIEALSLAPFRNGLSVNEFMQTSNPAVYACGDVTGFSLLAHTAVREAEVAVAHILGQNDSMSYRAIPAVVYTNPEMAGVGETEESLQQKGIPYRVAKLPMTFSGRFVAENELFNGLCKVLTTPDDHILGVHLLGNPASEIISLAVMAIENNLTLERWKRTVFPHPTVGEVFKAIHN